MKRLPFPYPYRSHQVAKVSIKYTSTMTNIKPENNIWVLSLFTMYAVNAILTAVNEHIENTIANVAHIISPSDPLGCNHFPMLKITEITNAVRPMTNATCPVQRVPSGPIVAKYHALIVAAIEYPIISKYTITSNK